MKKYFLLLIISIFLNTFCFAKDLIEIWDVHVVCIQENDECMSKRLDVLSRSKKITENILKNKNFSSNKVNIMVTWFGDIKENNKYNNKDIKLASDVINNKESLIAFFLLENKKTKTIDIWERSKNEYNFLEMIPIIDDDLIIIILPYK